MPTFSYYISPNDTPLTPESPAWQESLPLARPKSGKSVETIVSYGEYFDAVHSFLEQDGREMFSGVLAQRLQQAILPGDIRKIRIHLEKHGEFYHPARIEADVAGHTITFVINIAVSETGKAHITREFHTLKRLNTGFAESFLPRVYTLGEVTSGNGRKFFMFLGQWFKDYHEFHVSRITSGKRPKVCVWDDRNQRYYLSPEQTAQLYRQAARIMTYYYNTTTFEHISPWHHAAGDFIIKPDQNSVDLKLITVRGYAPLLRDLNDQTPGDGNVEQILQALLIFFLKLSIQMRLDRIDGFGDIVWLGSEVVQSTVQGLFDALAQKPADPILPGAVDTCFRYYLSNCSRNDLFELSESIAQTRHPAAPEISLIMQHLAEHVHFLIESIRKI